MLDLARADLAQCAQGPQTEPRLQLPIADPDQKSKMKGPFTNESAESLLDVAQAIWKTRLAVCGSPTSTTTENPLPLLVRKIGY